MSATGNEHACRDAPKTSPRKKISSSAATATAESVALNTSAAIELGAVKLQFWLAEVRQSDNRVREILVWLGLGLLILGEVLLIGWLQ